MENNMTCTINCNLNTCLFPVQNCKYLAKWWKLIIIIISKIFKVAGNVYTIWFYEQMCTNTAQAPMNFIVKSL
jgi:hypothetical protein